MEPIDDYIIHRNNKQFIQEIKKRNYGKVTPDKRLEIVERVKTFEALAQNRKQIIFLLSLNEFKLLYVSANVKDELDFEQEEMLEDKGKGIFNILAEESLQSPNKIVKWASNLRIANKEIKKQEMYLYMGGIKFKHKTKKTSNYFVRLYTVAYQNDKPSLVLFFVEDINHLMKNNLYWVYFVVGEQKQFTRFFSTQQVGEHGLSDIITAREKEIVEQINLGKSTKEISCQLQISVNTVERHRKNMIAKLGAKDSTALLQLCKMCGVL